MNFADKIEIFQFIKRGSLYRFIQIGFQRGIRIDIIFEPRLEKVSFCCMQASNRKILFLFLNRNICCGYSKELSQ